MRPGERHLSSMCLITLGIFPHGGNFRAISFHTPADRGDHASSLSSTGGQRDDICRRGEESSHAQGDGGARCGGPCRVLPHDGHRDRGSAGAAGRGEGDREDAAGAADRARAAARRGAALELRPQPAHCAQTGARPVRLPRAAGARRPAGSRRALMPRRRTAHGRTRPDRRQTEMRRNRAAPPSCPERSVGSGQRADLRLRPRPIFFASCERAAA